MASSSTPAISPAQATAPKPLLVNELPKFDLELYIQNYTGRTRFNRLLLIGNCCIPLRLEALKAAVAEAKNGTDVSQYKQAWDSIRKLAPDEPEAERDEAWIDTTEKSNKAETQRLELELKGYKNNLIKESIRMGNEDLGRHFEAIGKLNEAAEAYSRMRQDVSTTKHIRECGMHQANVSLQRRDWNMVITNIGKIAGVQSESSDEEKKIEAYSRVAAAVAQLNLGDYAEAANHLLKVDFAVPAAQYSHIISPNDIAVYGGLTALATMDRAELQRRVLDNQSFRTFLEHEPHIRKAVSFFVSGRYANCLTTLESHRSDYLLDIHLQQHVLRIYTLIRTKCIVQYFVGFSRITLGSMEAAFGLPDQSLEHELMEMIRKGHLNARIDSRNRLLVAVRPDPRAEMQKKSLQAARLYEKEATEHLRRIGIISAGLEVHPSKMDVAGLPGIPAVPGGPGETWYEDQRGHPVMAMEAMVGGSQKA